MKTKVGATKALPTVRTEIQQRLAALTPEQFVAPQRAHEPDAHVACIATDEIKRLYTLHSQLREKCTELSLSAIQMGEAAQRRLLSEEGVREVIREMRTPDGPALRAVEEMRRTHRELQQVFGLLEIVNDTLHLEILRQHADLFDKSVVYICSDWAICWKEISDDEKDSLTRVLMRGIRSGPDEVPPHSRLH